MDIKNSRIDAGRPFDWGRTSADYAKFRDIYPPAFYAQIVSRGLCTAGQRVLDIGTGTGVLPRNLYAYGASWLGTDISPEQTAQAAQLAQAAGMDIAFRTAAAETLDEPDGSFDVITACQCYWYFDNARVYPNFARMLRQGGKVLLLEMAWLPDEDEIAGASERLVLQYNPKWSGAGMQRHAIAMPEEARAYFDLTEQAQLDLPVHFTRESWHGRMKACRGTGASLTPEALAAWEQEHIALLEKIAPPEFDVLHFAALAVLTKR